MQNGKYCPVHIYMYFHFATKKRPRHMFWGLSASELECVSPSIMGRATWSDLRRFLPYSSIMRVSEFLTVLAVLCAELRSTGAAVQEHLPYHEARSSAEVNVSDYVHATGIPQKRGISLMKVWVHVLEAPALSLIHI